MLADMTEWDSGIKTFKGSFLFIRSANYFFEWTEASLKAFEIDKKNSMSWFRLWNKCPSSTWALFQQKHSSSCFIHYQKSRMRCWLKEACTLYPVGYVVRVYIRIIHSSLPLYILGSSNLIASRQLRKPLTGVLQCTFSQWIFIKNLWIQSK